MSVIMSENQSKSRKAVQECTSSLWWERLVKKIRPIGYEPGVGEQE